MMEVCWVETVGITNKGYARRRIPGDGRKVMVHTAVYEALVGPIDPGLEPDHLCRNRACYNPTHLEPVTHRENCDRRPFPNQYAGRTHCPRSHPYDEENTYVDSRGWRHCRTCQKARGK